MKNKGLLFFVLTIIGLYILSQSTCQSSEGNHTGYEYMPDMGHSVAYEANTLNYYRYNTWGPDSNLHAMSMPRKPVEGTIPRGFAGLSTREGEERAAVAEQMEGMPLSSYTPYYYDGSDSARALATAAIKENPFKKITPTELAQGKELYDVFCGICHGDKGDGNGHLARDGSPYSAQPTSYLTDDMKSASEGRYYHAIMHGKGVMGHYKDKINYKERWLVIHYIRSLQDSLPDAEYGGLVGNEMPEVSEGEEDAMLGATSFNVDVVEKLISQVTDNENADEAGEVNEAKPQEKKEAPALILENVSFKPGKSILRSESQDELNILLGILSKNEGVKIEIHGHTDNIGNATNNLKLSEARAKAVYDYLVDKGIAAERLTYKGLGDSKPLASNDTEDGKAKNRRTDFVILQ